jgi:hypothetical protein
MVFRRQVLSRCRFLFAALCVLAALLALHTRLSPYELQKAPIKAFADYDWLKTVSNSQTAGERAS